MVHAGGVLPDMLGALRGINMEEDPDVCRGGEGGRRPNFTIGLM